MTWLALDIGGANLKAAHQHGSNRSVPFPVWKHPDRLPHALSEHVSTLPAFDRLALSMTAELCDCFETKTQGVLQILNAVHGLRSPLVRVWTTDGRFLSVEEARSSPLLAAASNWLALAEYAARLVPDGPALLIDVGSTTTDLIPLLNGQAAPLGRTDTDRLRSGELVYAGIRRTPVCALGTSAILNSQSINLCAELFATTLDVYLVLGRLPPDPADLDTADGRPASVPFARDRLARMLGADRDSFSDDDARSLASWADSSLRQRLVQNALSVCDRVGSPSAFVVSGSGEWLAEQVAQTLSLPDARVIRLSDLWSPDASASACAQALLELARERVEP